MTARILAVGLVLMGVLALYLYFVGSAVLIDETGDVTSAAIVSGPRKQPLTRLWNGYFYGIPHLEGTIEVRCRSGSRNSWGYVTGNMHSKVRVVERDCRKLISD